MTYENIHVAECQAVIAYCDVTGFMTWVKRAEASRSDVPMFIQKMKFLFRRFREETGLLSIPIGDGIIALILDQGQGGALTSIFPLLEGTLRLQARMYRLIKETPYPRPNGFRVRVTAGHVFRTEEPPLAGQTVRTFDVIGSPMNLGSRLCEVRRELPAIIHESTFHYLTNTDRKHLILKRIEPGSDRPPRGVDPEDMKGLWTFRLKPTSG